MQEPDVYCIVVLLCQEINHAHNFFPSFTTTNIEHHFSRAVMKEKTDAELVLLTRAGSREAFGYLVERYQQMVRYIAMRLIAVDEIARELAQEAIVQAYLSLDHLRDPVSFKSWLYGIT